MATDYSTIIDAIDEAIASWADQPVSISSPDGRSITYRSLQDLLNARKYYAGLQRNSSVGRRFTITHLKSGGSRS